jgi:hypothetical protein
MNLESDKRLIQLRLDFSSAPTGEARQARREDIESLSVVSEPERPTNTLCLERVSATLEPPYTDPYVRWCGRGGAERLPPIPIVGTFETSRLALMMSVVRDRPEVASHGQNDAIDPNGHRSHWFGPDCLCDILANTKVFWVGVGSCSLL